MENIKKLFFAESSKKQLNKLMTKNLVKDDKRINFFGFLNKNHKMMQL